MAANSNMSDPTEKSEIDSILHDAISRNASTVPSHILQTSNQSDEQITQKSVVRHRLVQAMFRRAVMTAQGPHTPVTFSNSKGIMRATAKADAARHQFLSTHAKPTLNIESAQIEDSSVIRLKVHFNRLAKNRYSYRASKARKDMYKKALEEEVVELESRRILSDAVLEEVVKVVQRLGVEAEVLKDLVVLSGGHAASIVGNTQAGNSLEENSSKDGRGMENDGKEEEFQGGILNSRCSPEGEIQESTRQQEAHHLPNAEIQPEVDHLEELLNSTTPGVNSVVSLASEVPKWPEEMHLFPEETPPRPGTPFELREDPGFDISDLYK